MEHGAPPTGGGCPMVRSLNSSLFHFPNDRQIFLQDCLVRDSTVLHAILRPSKSAADAPMLSSKLFPDQLMEKEDALISTAAALTHHCV